LRKVQVSGEGLGERHPEIVRVTRVTFRPKT
jgi:hypothetical protein